MEALWCKILNVVLLQDAEPVVELEYPRGTGRNLYFHYLIRRQVQQHHCKCPQTVAVSRHEYGVVKMEFRSYSLLPAWIYTFDGVL